MTRSIGWRLRTKPGNGPFVAAISALVGGLAGMLAPTARAWYASVSAHRLLDI